MWGKKPSTRESRGGRGRNKLDTKVKSRLEITKCISQWARHRAHLTFAVLLNSRQSCSSSLSFFDAITGLRTSKTHYFLPPGKGPWLGASQGGSESPSCKMCSGSELCYKYMIKMALA